MPQKSAPKNILGSALKELRVSHGWTLENACARLRKAGMPCTARQLGRIEAQQKDIKDFEILYFCEVLGITRDELGARMKLAMVRHLRPKKR